jgi:hypothetical protein
MKLRERLVGLALIGLGFVGMGLVYLLWSAGAGLAPRPPLPPGMRPDLVPTLSPFTCILPLAAIASSLLVLEGVRRTILPD